MAENGMNHEEEEGEEHEEGEISDEEPPPRSSGSEEQVEPSSRVEVDEAVEPVEEAAHPPVASPQSSPERDPTPALRRRVSLDELVDVDNTGSEFRAAYGDQTRNRDSFGRRELDNPNEEDGGNSRKRNDWGAYGSNLYNFAWAQAVSGRPSFNPSAGDSPTISPTSKVSSDGLLSSGSGGLGSWLSQENIKLSREYSRDSDSYGRSLGRSSEERDDMSPLRESGSRPLDKGLLERDATSRGRRIIRETSWSGRTERFVTVKRKIEKERRGGLADDGFHRGHSDGEDGRWRKQRSDSDSPNGRLDEAEDIRGRSPSDAAEQGAQNGAENGNHEEREEGELEEGEIELPVGSLPDQKSASPTKEPPNPNREQNKYSGVKAGDDSVKDKKYARSLLVKSQSRSQIDDFSSRRHRQAKPQESFRENRLGMAGGLVKNVTVKDAQKSFVDVCNRLHRTLRILNEVHTPSSRQAGLQDGRQESSREITALTRQAFAGIRAVYAVRNTASGREQERDKNSFPRLLELANGYCQKLFTPKQTRELEVMMQTIANAGRLVRDGGAEKGQYPREHQFQPASNKKIIDTKANSSNPLGDNVGTAKLPASTDAKSGSESSIAGRILGIVDAKQAEEAAAIAAAALAYAQSSAAARANPLFSNTYDNRASGTSVPGIQPWGFLSESSAHVQFNIPGVNPLQPSSSVYNLPPGKYQPWNGTEQRPVKLGQDGFGGHFGMETKTHDALALAGSSLLQGTKEDLSLPSGYSKAITTFTTLEDEWEALSPPGAGMPFYRHLPPLAVKEPSQSKLWPSRPEMSPLLSYQKDGTAPSYPPDLLLNLNQQRSRANADMYSSERLPSPTPDEDDNPPVIAAPVAPVLSSLQSRTVSLDVSSKESTVRTQPQGAGNLLGSLRLPGSIHNLIRSQSLDGPGPVSESRLQKGTSGDVSTLSGERSLGHSESAINLKYVPNSLPTSLPPVGTSRSRDPRRRFQTNSVDLSDKGSMEQVIPGPNILTPGEAHSAGIDGNKKRLGLDFDDKQDLRMQKRLKGQPESNVDVSAFALDNLHGASGTGGWLDDNVVPSFIPVEELPMEMEVEEGGPSAALEGRNGVGIDSTVNSEGQLDGFPDNLNFMTGDTGQRKMKARDPRRAFLGSNAEKGDSSLGDALKVDGIVIVGPRLDEVAEVPSRNDKDMTQAPNQGANRAPLLLEKLASVAGIPPVNASEQLVSSEGVQGVSGPVDGSVDDGSMDVEVVSIPSETISQDFPELQKDKSSAAIVGPRKPKGTPSQWGASQVHPHLEQLLGDLSEEDRRSVQLERQRRMEEQDRMFSAGKLCLVLDLDHTLLNSAKFSEIEPEWDQRLRVAEAAERNRTARDGVERRELYRFPHMSMWTKLRPGIWKFLARASQLYELHVYTMGNKVYATEMAKLLDPTGKLFAGRVISKGDDGDGDDLLPKSKDLDGVLGMESAVVIIDDSARVWPHHSQNLIVVERYMYFPCSRRQFGLAGPSLLEVGHDERESDGMLASALGVIDRIHESFFKNPRLREVDVREILAAQQRQVLAGCKVVFSRVFPVGEAEPHRHPLWRTAEQFGAICSIGLDELVTHVVAISLGTDKVNWALETGRYVVRPAWLEASTILYRRANERDFPVLPQ